MSNIRRAMMAVPQCVALPANTTNLLHFEGADTSTTFTDEIGTSWTANGNAQIDTAQYKFGSASGLFDGSGDYIQAAASADWAFGTGSYTVAFWLRPLTAGQTTKAIIGNRSGANATSWMLQFGNTAGKLEMHSGVAVEISGATALSINTWYHVALVRNGASSTVIYIDGTSDGTATDANDYSSNVVRRIGSDPSGLSSGEGHFQIDELIVCKGTAVWTTAFTPPTRAYCNS